MRWDEQRIDRADPEALPGLDAPLRQLPGLLRSVRTPAFAGLTFHEVAARSIINEVPAPARVPFRWTVNPYRGCSHACRYCFARRTHTYLDLDAGRDFDTQIVVKVNAPELLRRELANPRWSGEPVAMGTNVDCYQRAEGRYALMPAILAALRDASNPFSILTKGTLILRDLPLLRQAAGRTEVGLNVSVGSVDRELWRAVEPGTPSPQARLRVVRELSAAGLECGVLMAPVLPYLTDAPDQLAATVAALAAAGAARITPIVLHLRPGSREWYLDWLARSRPDLVGPYHELYGDGAYAARSYRRRIAAEVAGLARRHGLGAAGPDTGRGPRTRAPSAQQLPRTVTDSEGPGAVQLALI